MQTGILLAGKSKKEVGQLTEGNPLTEMHGGRNGASLTKRNFAIVSKTDLYAETKIAHSCTDVRFASLQDTGKLFA